MGKNRPEYKNVHPLSVRPEPCLYKELKNPVCVYRFINCIKQKMCSRLSELQLF